MLFFGGLKNDLFGFEQLLQVNSKGENAMSEKFSIWIMRIWNTWDLRVLLFCSLISYVFLSSIGSRRKYKKGNTIQITVWSAYLMANWVAAFTLGKLSDVISRNMSKIDTNYALTALWAPLLLLHLGGPDAITANSVEDTQLWLRHALGLAIQSFVAAYVFVRCWTGSWLSLLTILMFVSAIIKYTERTFALWYANKDVLIAEEVDVGLLNQVDHLREEIPCVEWPMLGYLWLRALMPCLHNYIGDINLNALATKTFAFANDGKSLFKLVEFKLGFMFDVVYTKAGIMHTKPNFILRVFSFVSLVTVQVGFIFILKDAYSNVDVCFTYLLLGTAIALEVYAFLRLICSDWALVWMITNMNKPFMTPIMKILAPLILKQRRCSHTIEQLNLIELYTIKPRLERILDFLKISSPLKQHWCKRVINGTQYSQVKELIFKALKRILVVGNINKPFSHHGEMLLQRCPHLLELKDCIQWGLDDYIMIWHVATEINICETNNETENTDPMIADYKEGSRILSNYMMYLLLQHPSMLRITTGDVVFDSTCKELDLVKRWHSCSHSYQTIPEMLSRLPGDEYRNCLKVTDDMHPSLLFNAKQFAGRLLNSYKDRMWELTFDLWVEILCYAALNCQVDLHAQRLSQGGQLLTHVWLLLTIFGLSEKVNQVRSTLWSVAKEHMLATEPDP